MHIDDMKAPQRTQVAQTAGHCAIGALLALTHRWVWMTGILGFVLVTISAGRLAGKQPGFDRVQRLAALCAGCKLVTMAMQGIDLAVWIGTLLLPVLEILLVYALWQAFGRMCADGNRIGRAALCAMLLCAALTAASNVLALGIVGGIQIEIYAAAQTMAFGFEALAVLLLAAFLIVKRQKLKEDTV